MQMEWKDEEHSKYYKQYSILDSFNNLSEFFKIDEDKLNRHKESQD